MKHFRQIVIARTPEEAVGLRKAVGARSLYIAGGTTVVPNASKSVQVLIDITHLGLDGITVEDDAVSIGATTRLSQLLSPEVMYATPMLYDAARRCATPIIRNMATVGGSLAGIFLPSDIGVALLALGARLELTDDEDRSVSIDDLIAAGWLHRYALIRKIRVRKLRDSEGASFKRIARSEIDIALVNVATVIKLAGGKTIEDVRIAVGHTSSVPMFLSDAEPGVRGRQVSFDLIDRLATAASKALKTRSDFRASSQYRKQLARVLVARSLLESAKKAGFALEDRT